MGSNMLSAASAAGLRGRSTSPMKPARPRRRSTSEDPFDSTRDPRIGHDTSRYSDADRVQTPWSRGLRLPKNNTALDEKRGDIEAQSPVSRNTIAAEYQVATRTKLLYLAGYFALNLGLTIYNKAVLGNFHFPWLLTTIHASFVTIGCYILLLLDKFQLTELNRKDNLVLVAFSFLFTINIAVSNVSLAAVSVPFHQIMRSMCPIITVLIYGLWFKRSYSAATYLSVIPIILGVAIATYGDYYFTPTGFLLTLFGVVLSSVKTVVTNRLMTGSLALPALEVLLRMSPLAAAQALLYAWLSGETSRFLALSKAGGMPVSMAYALMGNGLLAYTLNISSFQTNKLAGALTLTVAANLKQCLTILLGIVLFNVRVTTTNGVGMLITVIGAAWYSKVELDSRNRR